jgi:curved DNA-binding protein CbpA
MSVDSEVDYYEVLQISRNAQPDTIHRVYRLLAQMYHPDNAETGNVECFNSVLTAYRVLSDPLRRASYDAELRLDGSHRRRIFDQTNAATGLQTEKRKRLAMLSLLYSKRMHDPRNPAISIPEFEQHLGCPREALEVSLWYLRESGSILRSDNGRFTLTAKGVDVLEQAAPEASHGLPLLLDGVQPVNTAGSF